MSYRCRHTPACADVECKYPLEQCLSHAKQNAGAEMASNCCDIRSYCDSEGRALLGIQA
uniref:Uncharacterized protein n=1 Tax=Anguilla anguilla TaxID=7936 RepID=A0A0E9WDY0_ANGAN